MLKRFTGPWLALTLVITVPGLAAAQVTTRSRLVRIADTACVLVAAPVPLPGTAVCACAASQTSPASFDTWVLGISYSFQ